MSFLRVTVIFKIFYPIIILSLLTISCSTDNSITDSRPVSKTYEITEINTDPDQPDIGNYIPPWIPEKHKENYIKRTISNGDNLCFIDWLTGYYVTAIDRFLNPSLYESDTPHKFRDNYLAQSIKGIDYIYSYYILSDYGIENNLVMKYPLEHLSIMETGIEVSQELQHEMNQSKILINKSTYDDLKGLTKVYRQSKNYENIEPVLDYLEADLDKYYNKTKSEIAADFEKN